MEGGAELGVQAGRDALRDGPAKYRQPALPGDQQRGPGGLLVVGVPGDATLVEDQQVAGVLLVDQPSYRRGQLGDWHGVQPPVGVVEQFHPAHTQHGGGGTQLGGADPAEVTGTGVRQRGGLAVGQAQHGDVGTAGAEAVQ